MTKIAELLADGRSVSIELWPPRNPEAARRLDEALEALVERLQPTFCSITYGAGGSTRERTHELVVAIEEAGETEPMAHLTCAAHRREELAAILTRYGEAGVENVLALRGDPPLDSPEALAHGELSHAIELVELAREVGDFSVAVAAHPDGHPMSPDLTSDRRFLAEKLRLADFAITQFFFESSSYVALVDELERGGIDKPVIPGILPVTNARTLSRMAEMSGAAVPHELARRIGEVAEHPDEVRRIGVEVATRLGDDLLQAGAPGLHFYTMNVAAATIEVCENLGLSAGRP